MTTILVAGTWDTKNAELGYIRDVIVAQGGRVLAMDVSVLGEASAPVDITKHHVAQAGGSTIAAAIDAQDENIAMQIMARGAAALAFQFYAEGKINGAIVLGGTMGTDLALDLCSALPLGVPKYIVSTVSFSAMLPPERLPADVQMILWAGGLYGLNSICKASLSQAAGAVLGAARAAEMPDTTRPMIGMTSFGKTVLTYMVALKPALEARGFDVAVFHATGMGGRAFENLAAAGRFAAVMDFAPQEVGNHLFGSAISAGPDRLTGAGRLGVPQMVSIGCCDLVDLVGWQPLPDLFADNGFHAHNRLLSSVVLNADQRRMVAREICAKLATAQGPVTLILPKLGAHEWDRDGSPLRDKSGLAAFLDEVKSNLPPNVHVLDLNCHINDMEFTDAALKVVDGWISQGVLPHS
jgi:uncharacterized protein (UPF0261 family)